MYKKNAIHEMVLLGFFVLPLSVHGLELGSSRAAALDGRDESSHWVLTLLRASPHFPNGA